MGKIINILGPHGVGKTTLQNYIKRENLGLVFEGFIVPQTSNDFVSKDSYMNYEKKYFSRIDNENSLIKKSAQDGYVIRSIEEIKYFLLNSKFEFNKKEIDVLLSKHVMCDYLIYLDADKKVLESRIIGDILRNMNETNQWYKNDFISYTNYFKNLSDIIIINTNNLTPDEVFKVICEKIDRKS